MNSDLSITTVDSDNYIGRFVSHRLRQLVDADNFHSMTELTATHSGTSVLVWPSDSPDATRAREIVDAMADTPVGHFVMLSSCSVYDKQSGTNINEFCPTAEHSDAIDAEHIIESYCKDNNIGLCILRLPLLVVGTGMNGRLMEMVNQIYRGSYFNIKNVDANVSVIHASAVAEAVALCIMKKTSGTFNINDNTQTTVSQLAEALSYRIGNKSIFSIKDSWARFARRLGDLSGMTSWCSDTYRFKTTTLTFSCDRFIDATSFSPASTTAYLKTHDYDEKSL